MLLRSEDSQRIASTRLGAILGQVWLEIVKCGCYVLENWADPNSHRGLSATD
jgi:hypothetical protein